MRKFNPADLTLALSYKERETYVPSPVGEGKGGVSLKLVF